MSDLPTLRTKEQIIGTIINGILARLDNVNDFNKGSAISQIIYAIGQSQFKSEASVIKILDALSIDRAEGESLQRLARDKRVPVFGPLPSTGFVTVTDLSFRKAESVVYAGQPAPVPGTIYIHTVDASTFPPGGGSIYIGRGTTNAEGPLKYVSAEPQGGGAYWLITLDAATPTTKFHNIGESIILSQGGNRIIGTGTVVQTKQATAAAAVTFSATTAVTILDGEVSASNIPVICQQNGPVGNVPRGAIQEIVGLSFDASVYNPQPLSNGRDADTNETIRKRIKEYEQTRAKGTDLALRTSVLNIVAEDEPKRVTSSSLLRRADNSSVVVIDDGSGYEYKVNGVGIEKIIDQALGGEEELQLRRLPIARARLDSGVAAPYNIPNYSKLSVTIGGVEAVHMFQSQDFRVSSSASAFEVAASINGNPNIHFLAATTSNGNKVTVFSRDRSKNDIKVNKLTESDANSILQFPLQQALTARLYRNDEAIFEDGLVASVPTNPKSLWLSSIAGGDTLTYVVDGATPITVAFTLSEFQAIEATAIVNYLTDINIWAQVMNNIMPGITATVDGETISITSNRGYSSKARVEIVGGTLKSKIFSTTASLISVGRDSDYKLNRHTGQILLTKPLLVNEQVNAGSAFTRAKILTNNIDGTSVPRGRMWFVVDGDTEIIGNGLQISTKIQLQKSAGSTLLTITGSAVGTGAPQGFEAVVPGDWLLLWAESADPIDIRDNQGWWRVESSEPGKVVVNGEYSAGGFIGGEISVAVDRIVIARTSAPIQRFEFGDVSVADFINSAREQLQGLNVDSVGSRVRFSTQTTDNGDIVVVAADAGGQALGVKVAHLVRNIPSHAAAVAVATEPSTPSFTHDIIDIAKSDHRFEDTDFEAVGGGDGEFIELLDRYDNTTLELKPDSNRYRYALVTKHDKVTNDIDILTPTYMRSGGSLIPEFVSEAPTIKTGDRYYLRRSYQFDSQDQVSVVVDGDVTTKSYTLPVARRVKISNASTPTHQSFSADDSESVLPLDNVSSFGNFDFADFRVWRQSHLTLTNGSGVDDYNIKFKAIDYGPAGNRIRVGIVYPDSPALTELSHNLKVSDIVDISVSLPFAQKQILLDGTTAFTVSKTTTNGRDSVTYTWRAGTDPEWVGGAEEVGVGDVAIVSTASDFLSGNCGFSAKVENITPDSITLTRPAGLAVNDALVFSDISNINGIVTVDIGGGHGIAAGDRIGFYDTAESLPGIAPFDSTYYANIVSSTRFTVPTPAQVPGGAIASVIHNANRITVAVPAPHNLEVGNIIRLSGLGSPYDGLMSVSATPTPTQFHCQRQGSSASISGSGRYDFQSYVAAPTSTAITSAQRNSAGKVTVTATAHGFVTGQLVQVNGVNISLWVTDTAYVIGDVVKSTLDSNLYKLKQLPPAWTAQTYPPNSVVLHSGKIYRAINSTAQEPPHSDWALAGDPSLELTFWQQTDKDLTGIFVITKDNDNTFSYYYDDLAGTTDSTGGSCVRFVAGGALARCVGADASLMVFGETKSTAQEVVDYVTENMSGFVTAETVADGGAEITDSTADNDSDYLFGNVIGINTILSSRVIVIDVNNSVPAGSEITINLPLATEYNGKYVILKSETNKLTAQSSVIGAATGPVTDSDGTYTGTAGYAIGGDGENAVESFDPKPIPSTDPMFVTKHMWQEPPEVGEELRLLAITSDQLTRFWNVAAVSGLFNVADIENNGYGRQIQIMSKTLASTGSVQVSGGYANTATAALVGTSEQTHKTGTVYVPYSLRRGLVPRNWVMLSQIMRQNKSLGFAPSTEVEVKSNGIALNPLSPGTFQVKRTLTSAYDTVLKIERHGDFVAVIGIGGSGLGLLGAGVGEGDWVRIRNVIPPLYDSAKTYVRGNKIYHSFETFVAIDDPPSPGPGTPDPLYWKKYSDYDAWAAYVSGDYVSYNGRLWLAIDSSTGIVPGSNLNFWQPQEFDTANEGVFRVVRVFGDNTFWIENVNAVEEICTLMDVNDLTFYSYDSVMPGDALIMETTVLDPRNWGRYVVADDDVINGTFFPEADRIWVLSAIPVPISPRTLNGDFRLLNIEEKEPFRAWKRILAVGASANDTAAVVFDSPELTTKTSPSLGAYMVMGGKLGFDTNTQYGLDGYKYFGGLIAQANKVIYGSPVNTLQYPGVRAGGTDVDIEAAILRRIFISLSVRIRSEIPFIEVREQIKAAVAGYVNRLGVGEQVSISAVVAAASNVSGVLAVVVTYPQYDVNNDLIAVGANERAIILTPTTDVVVSILAST